MASIALKNLQSSVARKYEPLEIPLEDQDGETLGTVTLHPALRLDKDSRKALSKLQQNFGKDADGEEDGADAVDFFQNFLRIVSKDDPDLGLLFELVDDDIATYAEIIKTYTEETQPGEASSSES